MSDSLNGVGGGGRAWGSGKPEKVQWVWYVLPGILWRAEWVSLSLPWEIPRKHTGTLA